MKSCSCRPPFRYLVDSVSKSSNSRSRIGITYPGTFSTTSGFASDPARGSAFLMSSEAGSIEAPSGRRQAGRDQCSTESTKSLSEYRSEEHTSELQSLRHLVCRLL